MDTVSDGHNAARRELWEPPVGTTRKVADQIIDLASGEWLLTKLQTSNGGTIVFIRSVLVTALVYLLYLGARNFVDPTRTLHFDYKELLLQLSHSGSSVAKVFAASYVAFYTRLAVDVSCYPLQPNKGRGV